MKVLDKENLLDLVKEGIHLVDFYAQWCGPCKMLMPILESIDKNVDIIKVDVDMFPELASNYGIMSIPTLIYFKDGEVVKKVNGFQDKNSFIKDIEEISK
ncbi:MAG: thioredoxin [Bacilli bacterium]